MLSEEAFPYTLHGVVGLSDNPMLESCSHTLSRVGFESRRLVHRLVATTLVSRSLMRETLAHRMRRRRA